MSSTEQSVYNEVFISYSRKNVDFARKLVDAIYDSGRENVWIDWEDIEYAEDWWRKIQQGIDSAENFLFILTPDSVQSKVCYDEVDYALQSGKRIIPIAYIEITDPEDFEKIHPAISQHNWLPFANEDDFDASMAELFKTIDTDLDHVRFHTRMQTRAREWEQQDRTQSYLLTTGELSDAQTWLESVDAQDKIPAPTSIQREFIALSQVADDDRRQRERKLEERARRNRLYLAAAIPSIIGFVIASVFAVQAFNRSREANQRSQEANQAASDALEELSLAEREAALVNSIGLSTRALFWGRNGEDPLLGLSYALEANEIENPPIVSQFTLAEIAWQPGARRQMTGHLGEVWGVAYSPDGQYIFTGAGSFTGLPDNRLIQWDAATGDIVREFDQHEDRIYSVAVSPDGRYIATGSQDTNVMIWDFASGEVLHVLGEGIREHGVPIFNVMFTHDSTRLVSAGADRIIVWDVETGAIINRFEEIHGDHILDMDISDDDRLVFSGSFDDTIRLWNLEDGSIIHAMEAGQITGARLFPNESRAVTSDQDGNIIIWNMGTGEAVRTIEHEEAPLRGGVLVTPNGEQIVAADDNGNVMIWELAAAGNAPIVSFRGHDSRITSLDMHPLGTEIATVSFDYSMISWDIVGRDAEIRRFENHMSSVYASTMSTDGRLVASGASDGSVLILDADTGDIIHDIATTDGIIYSLSFNPDATQLAAATESGSVIILNTETGEIVQIYTDLQAPARNLIFSPDGNLLAAGGGQVQVSANRPIDNRIIIWNTDGEIVQTLDGHNAAVRALAFTPDSTHILSGSDDTRIILWDVETAEQITTYSNHSDAVWSLSFNQDGSQFVSGSRDTSIILWETNSGVSLKRLETHQSGVRAVAFHPDGIHLVSGAGNIDTASALDDYELLYWNLEQGEVLRELPGHELTIRSLMFNPDGTQILSSSDDGVVILWYADTLETLLQRTRSKYQVVCIPEASDQECEDTIEIVTSDADDDTNQVIEGQGFPLQTSDITLYTEGSLCLLPDNGNSPPNDIVDTSNFMQEAPYVIGYSDGGVDGTSGDWVAAWADYQADQEDLVSGFVIRTANGNPPQQARDLQLLIDAGADAIIINPIERAESNMTDLQDAILEVIEMGIPVILVGNRTIDPVYTSYVGHDSYEVGCIMAQELAALIDGEGSIGLINGYDLSVADVRFKSAARNILGNYSNILFTVEGPTNYLRDNATNLARRSEVAGILGYVSDITLGTQDGLASQGAPYASFVSDHSVELARFAQENEVEGVMVQSSAQMGAEAIRTALMILQGESVSQFIRIEPTLIYSDDLSDYDLDNAPDNAYLGDWEDLPESYYPEEE